MKQGRTMMDLSRAVSCSNTYNIQRLNHIQKLYNLICEYGPIVKDPSTSHTPISWETKIMSLNLTRYSWPSQKLLVFEKLMLLHTTFDQNDKYEETIDEPC